MIWCWLISMQYFSDLRRSENFAMICAADNSTIVAGARLTCRENRAGSLSAAAKQAARQLLSTAGSELFSSETRKKSSGFSYDGTRERDKNSYPVASPVFKSTIG